MDSENDTKGAGVKFPPLLLFLVVIGAAYGIHYVYPMGLGGASELKYVGGLVIILGIGVIVMASLNFKRAKTTIEPWKPSTAIISTGIYRYSRNPIYLALCLIQMGIGLALNNFWILIAVLVYALLLYHMAIKKEEAYLESKFGEEYTAYKNKVRRWI